MNYHQKKIGFAAVSLVLFIALFMIFGRKKERKEEFITVSEKSDIKTKLDALRAKRKGEKEALHTVSFYEEETKSTPAKVIDDAPCLPSPKRVTPANNKAATKPKRMEDEGNRVENDFQKMEKEATPRINRAELIQNAWGKENTQGATKNTSSYHEAVVHGTQDVTNGGILLIRTKTAIEQSGHVIPANTLISAHATFSKNRVEIRVQSVKTSGKIIPLSFTVYASDGLLGLPIHYDTGKEIMDSEISKEVFDAIEESANKLSKGIGTLTTGIAKGIKREREQKVTILHNTALYLKNS